MSEFLPFGASRNWATNFIGMMSLAATNGDESYCENLGNKSSKSSEAVSFLHTQYYSEIETIQFPLATE